MRDLRKGSGVSSRCSSENLCPAEICTLEDTCLHALYIELDDGGQAAAIAIITMDRRSAAAGDIQNTGVKVSVVSGRKNRCQWLREKELRMAVNVMKERVILQQEQWMRRETEDLISLASGRFKVIEHSVNLNKRV